MRKPLFFVQNNHVQPLTIPVARFAHSRGHALEDRSSTRAFSVPDCGIDWGAFHPVLPYGSVQFVRKLRASAPLAQYVHYSEDAFSTAHWTRVLGERAVNHRGRLMLSGDVAALLNDGPAMHVRPEREDKAFTAAVFDASAWAELTCRRELAQTLPCWVSPPVAIEAEWRCWVLGSEVVEISQYRRGGEHHRALALSPELVTVAQTLANAYLPAPCVVMDIARTTHGHQVLEYNPIHSSGWYAARTDRVLAQWLEWSLRHFG